MNQEHFEHWGEMAKKLQEPFQAMTELNVRTLQSLNYLKPEDLTEVKKPEELLEKQIDLAIANGHKALDYMQQSFQIFEKAMLGLVRETKNAVDEVKNEVSAKAKKL